MKNASRSRKILTMIAVGTATAALMAVPVSATPQGADGSHKITICHVTNSATNRYVIIDVDVAAFDGEGANDHTRHVSKDGLADVPYNATTGECETGTTDPPGDNT